jgi:hypothetical protein
VISKVPVIGANLQYDVLIGLDIICRGDFAISNYNNSTQFTFRIPSICDIDFCKHSYKMSKESDYKIGRNDPCPCGSGKKYKKCCFLKNNKS